MVEKIENCNNQLYGTRKEKNKTKIGSCWNMVRRQSSSSQELQVIGPEKRTRLLRALKMVRPQSSEELDYI
jgi:hypothetical protein